MGTAATSAGAAGPSRDYGQDGAADGLSRNAPLHAYDTTTGSGPTRQSDARDSEPDYSSMSNEGHEARAGYNAHL
jgi:hypothetical protein